MPTCDHCLLEFPAREAVYDEIEGQRKVFCCTGCSGIYRLIHSEGLEAFYERRRWSAAGAFRPERDIDMSPFAERVRDLGAEKELDLYIDGIRCASCVWLNEKILQRTKGVGYARVNYATHRAKIRWKPEVIGLEDILRRIRAIGYNPKPWSESEQFLIRSSEKRDLLVRFGTAGFLSSQLMIYSIALYAGYFQGIDAGTKRVLEVIAMFLTVPVVFYSGMPFFRSTVRGLRHLHFTMDSLIAVGSGSAFIYSVYQMITGGRVYFDTAAMIVTLILLGRYIEAAAKGRAAETIERLSELSPREATVIRSDRAREMPSKEVVPVSSLKKDDIVEVKPGGKIPADGIVVSGESEVDESLITGESRPVPKTSGSEVIGGSVNLYGAITFRLTKTGGETVLAGIIRAVEEAQAKKIRIQAFADRVVGIFVPVILVAAALTVMTYLLMGRPPHRAFMTGVSVLVIACPCSLGLATPLAVLMFATVTTSKGILIKGGEVIENASRITSVIFDKTGTITIGRPVLKQVVSLDPGFDMEYLLALAASLETFSEHSIGKAVTAAARGIDLIPVSAFRAIPGRGVEGFIGNRKISVGNRTLMREAALMGEDEEKEMVPYLEGGGETIVYVGWEGKVRGILVISDVIRDEARGVAAELKRMGIDVSIVSGDNRITTEAVGSVVGADHVCAEFSPTGKRDRISALQAGGKRVMMIGDGINDAPALTEASVGVAMGRGTDIALESSDAVLVRNDLRLVPYFIAASKRTYSIIKQNVFWAFFYNIVAVPLAVAGWLHPIVAAGAMAASSLFVVGNSLRIGARSKT